MERYGVIDSNSLVNTGRTVTATECSNYNIRKGVFHIFDRLSGHVLLLIGIYHTGDTNTANKISFSGEI